LTANSISLSDESIKIFLSIFPQGGVCFDCETTGLSPLVSGLIELAGIKIYPDGNYFFFDHLIAPQTPITKESMAIHGITPEMVATSPTSNVVLKDFFHFCEELPLIAHNAAFDAGFILYEGHTHQLPIPQLNVYCTLKLFKAIHHRQPSYKLQTLAETLNSPYREYHRALSDTLNLYWVMTTLYQQRTRSLEMEELRKRSLLFNLSELGSADELEKYPLIEELTPYMKSNQDIEIRYMGGSMKNKFRPIRPLGIIPFPHGPVLQAECLLSNKVKSFRLNKIKTFRLNGEDEHEA
jgi:DNA polymerase III subunit epsilon